MSEDAKEARVETPEPKDGEETTAAEERDDDQAQEAEVEFPTLDHRLLHAANRMGLTEDDLKALGDKAEPVLTKFADSLDEVSSRFAELGRATQEAVTRPPSGSGVSVAPTTGQPAVAGQPAQVEPAFTFDFEGLKQSLGEDIAGPLHERLGKPVADALNSLHQRIQEVSTWIAEQENERVRETVKKFFTRISDRYGDVYGTDGQRTPAQQRAYREAVMLADALLAGRQATGNPITVEEALEDAVYLHQKEREKQKKVAETTGALREKSKEVGVKATQRGKKPPTPEERKEVLYRQWYNKVFR